MAQVVTKAGLALGTALDPENPARLMTQSELARRLQVKQPSVSAWVAMTTRPEVHYRRAIQRVLAAEAIEKGTTCDIAEDDWMTDAERAIANVAPPAASSAAALSADDSGSRASVSDDAATKHTGTS